MWEIFNIKDREFVSNVKTHSLFNVLNVIFFFLIAFILATRDFGIAKDDHNYLNHFYNARNLEGRNLFIYLIEEPLWKLYTWFITLFFSPKVAFKMTIFISSFLFLKSVNKVYERLFIFLILVFILHQDFATQMYFNQLRQGFALSLFVFLTTYKKKPIIGGLLATLIHTSFFIPFSLIILILKVDSLKRTFFYVVLGFAIIYLNLSLLKTVDLGRRADSYMFENKFTINYYILSFLRYVPLFFLFYFYGSKKKFNFWYRLALFSFVTIVPMTLLYNAAGRLMYYVSAFVLLMILENYRSSYGKIALLYYLLFILLDLIFFESSVIGDWLIILRV